MSLLYLEYIYIKAKKGYITRVESYYYSPNRILVVPLFLRYTNISSISIEQDNKEDKQTIG